MNDLTAIIGQTADVKIGGKNVKLALVTLGILSEYCQKTFESGYASFLVSLGCELTLSEKLAVRREMSAARSTAAEMGTLDTLDGVKRLILICAESAGTDASELAALLDGLPASELAALAEIIGLVIGDDLGN